MPTNGKFIDRNPDIPTAGKLLKSVETVGDCLKIYSREEEAFNILKLKSKKKRIEEDACLGYSQFLPPESVLKDLLSPELKKSRFVAFKEKFSEDMYFKKPELGQASIVNSKSDELTNENRTYGLKTIASERVYDLIYPKEIPDAVNQENFKFPDKFMKAHKRYLPSECIKRFYNNNFNPHATFGEFQNADQSGHRIKKCLQHCDRMTAINEIEKKFLDRKFGRCNSYWDPCQTFGIQTKNKDNFDARTLIENVERYSKKDEINEAISHINKLRRIVFNRSDLHMHDLKILLKKYEENEDGFITIKSITKVLRSLQIHANEEKIRVALSHFGMLKRNENEVKECVGTDEFSKILHMQFKLPRKTSVPDGDKTHENKQTTYRLLCSDREKPIAHEIPRSLVDNHITAGDLINPDTPLKYGLNPSDFQILRSKDELKSIFEKLLPQNFDEVWQSAVAEGNADISSKMSVAEFRNFINKKY